ncbi:MAG: type II toxin-antitoxin system Phd/YefM family antitoxin [Chloroflexi bacterium]|nr:type II toxin-antitoxin system Phd/YefM family antitoxin [Chloroflexota bacterium]
MANDRKKRRLQVIVEDGKPSAVIIDIDDYRDMLEQLEDLDDLKDLAEMRKRPLDFKKLDDFLEEYSPSV